jgi:hypothetical protein
MNAVKEAFNLKTVQLDGQLEPVDQLGFTVAEYSPGQTIVVSGSPVAGMCTAATLYALLPVVADTPVRTAVSTHQSSQRLAPAAISTDTSALRPFKAARPIPSSCLVQRCCHSDCDPDCHSACPSPPHPHPLIQSFYRKLNTEHTPGLRPSFCYPCLLLISLCVLIYTITV